MILIYFSLKFDFLSLNEILSYVDYLIVGKYEQDKRDVSLWLRGSSNQKVLDLKTMHEKNKNKPLEIDRK